MRSSLRNGDSIKYFSPPVLSSHMIIGYFWRVKNHSALKMRVFVTYCKISYADFNGMYVFIVSQFVVIFIICVVSLLILYMVFLLCLDPLLIHRTKTNYMEQRNEEVRSCSKLYLVWHGKCCKTTSNKCWLKLPVWLHLLHECKNNNNTLRVLELLWMCQFSIIDILYNCGMS